MKTNSSVQPLTDELLVEEIIKTKDTSLFGDLYDRYSKIVYNKCYSFTNNVDEAKDLAQDIFLKLYINLGKCKYVSKFSAWLYVFTYNHCVNYITREQSKKIENKSVPIEDERLLIDHDDNSLFQLKVDKLKEALELIEPDEKMILLLKYQDDIKIKELVTIMELSESAVKMRLKRAKGKLIKKYNEIQ
ncbi:RNA polymerase sigma factor [Aureibaculum marinum]|uniref:RNA polymerase sigma factor n=1 Tax=Aureibaculum marinum TaxID=2487930 RepID=A0A3N4NIH3_9FLAO|nr:RNA polymerase sigma factor [Aureibaculum marinum]RPD96011.1 RNA polymerase sigma factor [Aureibaculum marinum]